MLTSSPDSRANPGEGDVNSKELRELIELVSKSNFSTFELEREGFRLKLVKGEANPAPARVERAPQAQLPADPGAAPAADLAPAPVQAAPEGLAEVRSPIVGTFYRAPSPGAAPFVEVGDRVRKGQVLCVVEAMKLMNEIEAEIDAEVVEIVAENGQAVEYGQVLFRLRPLPPAAD